MIDLYKYANKLDLHGESSDIAKILINEFIEDNYIMGNKIVIIIHGIGEKILLRTTNNILAKNDKAESFKQDIFNMGRTIVKIKNNRT